MHCVNRFAIIIILLSIYYHGKGNTKVQGLYKLSPYTNTHTDYITKYKSNYSYIIDSIIDGMVLLSMIVYTISDRVFNKSVQYWIGSYLPDWYISTTNHNSLATSLEVFLTGTSYDSLFM